MPSDTVSGRKGTQNAASEVAPSKDAQQRQPTTVPPFTIADLKRAIPKHCFERSTLRSIGFVVHDLAIASVLFFLATFIDHPSVPSALSFVLWPIYWYLQGNVLTGVWVIAHECGHRAFSDSVFVCDAFGMVLHSALLVPYHGWRISHAKHHRNTNHMDRDEVYRPARLSNIHLTPYDEMPAIVSFLVRVWEISRIVIFGWPTYLMFHVTGRDYGKHTDHFNPYSPLFLPKERRQIVLSDLFLMAAIGAIAYASSVFGFWTVVKYYGVPYLWVNFWLTLITYLQHTDLRLPHYDDKEWTWLRGAICTIDRDYGILNYFHHHIGDTHVVHHLFSMMPHYHAEEATRCVRPILGSYYVQDTGKPGVFGIMETMWKTITKCRAVDGDQVLWFKDRNDAKQL